MYITWGKQFPKGGGANQSQEGAEAPPGTPPEINPMFEIHCRLNAEHNVIIIKLFVYSIRGSLDTNQISHLLLLLYPLL